MSAITDSSLPHLRRPYRGSNTVVRRPRQECMDDVPRRATHSATPGPGAAFVSSRTDPLNRENIAPAAVPGPDVAFAYSRIDPVNRENVAPAAVPGPDVAFAYSRIDPLNRENAAPATAPRPDVAFASFRTDPLNRENGVLIRLSDRHHPVKPEATTRVPGRARGHPVHEARSGRCPERRQRALPPRPPPRTQATPLSQNQNEWIPKAPPLAGVQRAAPSCGVRGNAPGFPPPTRLPAAARLAQTDRPSRGSATPCRVPTLPRRPIAPVRPSGSPASAAGGETWPRSIASR
jgi:hypothetical protein